MPKIRPRTNIQRGQKDKIRKFPRCICLVNSKKTETAFRKKWFSVFVPSVLDLANAYLKKFSKLQKKHCRRNSVSKKMFSAFARNILDLAKCLPEKKKELWQFFILGRKGNTEDHNDSTLIMSPRFQRTLDTMKTKCRVIFSGSLKSHFRFKHDPFKNDI